MYYCVLISSRDEPLIKKYKGPKYQLYGFTKIFTDKEMSKIIKLLQPYDIRLFERIVFKDKKESSLKNKIRAVMGPSMDLIECRILAKKFLPLEKVI